MADAPNPRPAARINTPAPSPPCFDCGGPTRFIGKGLYECHSKVCTETPSESVCAAPSSTREVAGEHVARHTETPADLLERRLKAIEDNAAADRYTQQKVSEALEQQADADRLGFAARLATLEANHDVHEKRLGHLTDAVTVEGAK